MRWSDPLRAGALPTVIILRAHKSLDPEALEKLRQDWEDRLKGPAKASSITFLGPVGDLKVHSPGSEAVRRVQRVAQGLMGKFR